MNLRAKLNEYLEKNIVWFKITIPLEAIEHGFEKIRIAVNSWLSNKKTKEGGSDEKRV